MYTQSSVLINMFTKDYSKIDPKTIKKRLIDLGLTQSDLARELGVGRSSISLAISGKLKSKRIVDYFYEKGLLAVEFNKDDL